MIRVLEKMMDLLRTGETFAVATVLSASGTPGRIGHKMIVRSDGSTYGTIGGGSLEEKVKEDCLEALRRGEGTSRSYVLSKSAPGGLDSLCGGRQEMAIEIVPGAPHVLILGGGHVGRAVATLCRQLEYAYTVVDDRPETCAGDWPGAAAVVCRPPDDFLRDADLTPFSHALLLNYAYRHDQAALEAALENFTGIIGMIGSERKRDRLYENLPERLRSEASRVRCPVGIPIPVRSPAEIAVAILAEIIVDRYGREGIGELEAKRFRKGTTLPQPEKETRP